MYQNTIYGKVEDLINEQLQKEQKIEVTLKDIASELVELNTELTSLQDNYVSCEIAGDREKLLDILSNIDSLKEKIKILAQRKSAYEKAKGVTPDLTARAQEIMQEASVNIRNIHELQAAKKLEIKSLEDEKAAIDKKIEAAESEINDLGNEETRIISRIDDITKYIYTNEELKSLSGYYNRNKLRSAILALTYKEER